MAKVELEKAAAITRGDYYVRLVDQLVASEIEIGSVIYLPTRYGSSYILEVSQMDRGYVRGLLSRRGGEVVLKGITFSNLDEVPASVYVDGGYVQVGFDALICPNDSPCFNTGELADGLQLITPAIEG